MFSHGFPTPSRFGSDAPKAKLTTAAFAHGIPSSWHHVRQQHGRKPVRGPVRTFLRMLFHDMDTANYTSDSLSDLRPTYSPLPTTPRPSSTLLWRLSHHFPLKVLEEGGVSHPVNLQGPVKGDTRCKKECLRDLGEGGGT